MYILDYVSVTLCTKGVRGLGLAGLFTTRLIGPTYSVKEILDYFLKVSIFIKLNFYNAYYKLYIKEKDK